jgi:P-type Cu2+ transporter
MTSAALSPELAPLDDALEGDRFTRWVAAPGGARRAEASFALSGMHCAACGGLIEQALRAVPGVDEARVSAASERALVRWDPARTRASALVAAVRQAGYDAAPDAAAPARALRQAEARRALWRLFVAGFCGMQVMMMATPVYVAEAGELTPDMWQLLAWGSWLLCLPVLAFSAGPFFAGAWQALARGRIGMDVPVALGIAITFVASSGAAFAPGGVFGHELYFDSLTMFVAFLLAARWLEMRARHRAAEGFERELARLPETAWRVRGEGGEGGDEPVSVLRLAPGDVVRVPLGQAFPADGVLLAGQTRADEALLSGESRPVDKAPGDELVAGSVNLGSAALMRVQRVGADTRHAAIVALMQQAATQRPASARWADRWAAPFLWTVLLLAAGAALVWSWIDPSRAVWVAVSVLIVTCPCALSLAVPSTLLAAARGLAQRGVSVRRLDALEAWSQIDQVFFDKTGTLTDEVPAVERLRLLPAAAALLDEAGVWRRARELARWSTHPLARAVVLAAPAQAPLPDEGATPAQELQGRGLRMELDGHEWRLGSAAWAQEGAAGTSADEGDAALVLARDGLILAAFELRTALRAGAAETVTALRQRGVRVTLLSGDRPERAAAVAQALGLDDGHDVRAGASAEHKLQTLRAAQAEGRKVAMVGDGINDAPVLAQADVSVAMGQGALVARATADVVLSSPRLDALLDLHRSSARTMRIVRQNIAWAASYNALCVPLALAGWLPPWAAGIGMATSSLFVVLNALRAAR